MRNNLDGLSDYHKDRRKLALKYAWLMRPYVLAMLDRRMTQRQIVTLFNEAGAATPSEYRPEQTKPAATGKGWTLGQVQRFMERIEQAGRQTWIRRSVCPSKKLFRHPEVVAELRADAAKAVSMQATRAVRVAWGAAVSAAENDIAPKRATEEEIGAARDLWTAHMAAAYYTIETLLGSDLTAIRAAVENRTLQARIERGDPAAARQLIGMLMRRRRQARGRDEKMEAQAALDEQRIENDERERRRPSGDVADARLDEVIDLAHSLDHTRPMPPVPKKSPEQVDDETRERRDKHRAALEVELAEVNRLMTAARRGTIATKADNAD